MRSKAPGILLSVIGGVLVASAIGLTVYNLVEDSRASYSVMSALEQISIMTDTADEITPPETEPADTSVTEDTQEITEPLESETVPETELRIPEHLRDPYIPMPELEINGEKYVGVIHIPSLSLRLPVISEWSYPRLKLAPCRYGGSVYLDNIIIMGHNFTSHFGPLSDIRYGDSVIFEDMSGNLFQYEVVEIETLDGKAVKDMTAGDWDLTLFTCTLSGQSRLTVRCQRTAN